MSIPIPDRKTPSRAQVYQFLAFALQPANQPVLVHCAAGKGRTGIMVALFRVIAEGWAAPDALEEARRYGMTSKSQRRFVETMAREYRDGNHDGGLSSVLGGKPCDRETQPAPHWGMRGLRCVKSCAALGGVGSPNRCERRGLASLGDGWDADYCCKVPGSGSDAAVVSQAPPPARMAPGQKANVSVTVRNTGTTAWSEEEMFRLGAQSPVDNLTWGGRILLGPGEVMQPGEEKTFAFVVTAPSDPGVYNFHWRMLHELVEWFGGESPNVAVRVE